MCARCLSPHPIKGADRFKCSSHPALNMKLILLVVSVLVPVVTARLPYIVGGRDVREPGKWPWQASLQMYNSHGCGAAILSSQWILTAAHCVGSSVSMYSVVLGMHDRSMRQGQPKRYQVGKIIKHEGYTGSGNGLPNDIALLRLSTSADLSSKYATAVLLPNYKENFAGNPNCWITGWGGTYGGGPMPNILQEANVDVHTTSYCRSIYGSGIGDNHVCTNKQHKSGACNGDSGGPLSCNVSGTWKLVGVTSFGVAGCSPSFPSVYTNVAYYRNWIKGHTGI